MEVVAEVAEAAQVGADASTAAAAEAGVDASKPRADADALKNPEVGAFPEAEAEAWIAAGAGALKMEGAELKAGAEASMEAEDQGAGAGVSMMCGAEMKADGDAVPLGEAAKKAEEDA